MTDRLAEIREWHKGGVWRSGDIPYLLDRLETVENRVIELPIGTPTSALVEANNYLSARLVGRTLDEARVEIAEEMEQHRSQLDSLTSKVIEAGLATWGGGENRSLIVRGRAKLLEDVTAIEDLEHIRERNFPRDTLRPRRRRQHRHCKQQSTNFQPSRHIERQVSRGDFIVWLRTSDGSMNDRLRTRRLVGFLDFPLAQHEALDLAARGLG